jgi:hypothetical protein
MIRTTWRDRRMALLLALLSFAAYNSNGREIPSYDSQPTRLAARELLLRGTLGLGHAVGAAPLLSERPGFVLARDGRYRSAYSPVPSVVAAGLTWPLWKLGVLDLRAPGGANVLAAFSASVISGLSVGLVFFMARGRLAAGGAAAVALGFGLGTGMWPTVSQTLWQHETAILGLAIAMLPFTREPIEVRGAVAIGAGLALAGMARPQLSPAIAVVLAGTFALGGAKQGAVAAAIAGSGAAIIITCNLLWFGTPLGAAPMLEALHETVHGISASFTLNPEGLAGLLISPNRGLLVYSPVVLVAAAGLGTAVREGMRSPLLWCLAAATVQWLFYGSYAVWWGGYTYGPRYMLDVLPLAAPLAAAGLAVLRTRIAHATAVLLLTWSVVVAATGAFCYPHEQWNNDPTNVDRDHARLWDWTDIQIARCWQRGPSPQNFNLFTREAFRRPPGVR